MAYVCALLGLGLSEIDGYLAAPRMTKWGSMATVVCVSMVKDWRILLLPWKGCLRIDNTYFVLAIMAVRAKEDFGWEAVARNAVRLGMSV